jgi:predicted metal-dependent hydrolase
MKSKVKVTIKPRGVFFSIDQQTFHINTGHEDEPKKVREEYFRWYARQLRIAFKRLKDSYGTNRKVRR